MLLARLQCTTNKIAVTLTKRITADRDKIVLENQVNSLRLGVRAANGATEAERTRRLAAEQRVEALNTQVANERAKAARCVARTLQ